jgi:BirA family biotin operon repressor/biotin-[acetyl-CoA-carboxylase] ligase
MNKKLNKNFIKVVDILRDGEYHDGTTIGDQLGMTRSAVWKTIKKLESYHIKIDSVKGKGYALLEPLILLDQNKIKKNILLKKVDLSVFESIDSTNTYLSKFKNTNTIKICLAEKQTQGRGRFNRPWYSPFGKNIHMSLLYPFKKDISELSGLSLAISLAIYKTLKQYGMDEKLWVKWPNDILYANKKISGSLIEVQAETHGACQVVIGIPLNVNIMNDEQECITQPWTSLQKIMNTYVDRNILCASLINNLVEHLQQFETHGLSSFIKEWQSNDCLMGKLIEVKNIQENVAGKVQGINEQGHLLLKLKNGNIRAFASGETSIVKK